ncbi:MAG TPA: PKD domain-containing protein, partial [Chitinophagaceae bacterium]|nr:PKD domain-containing protein [Chitinophagaceae bacterium]
MKLFRKPAMVLISTCLVFFALGSTAYSQRPTADFKSDASFGCSPFVVNFTDQSTGNPTKWEWDLGNGSKSNLKNPAGIYFTPGIYTVTLVATNSNGSSTSSGTITVYENPKPKFISDTQEGCAPVQVRFTDRSEAGNNSMNSKWLWDFGNGVQSTAQHPTNKYTVPGIFTVVLKVTNDKGCSAVYTEDKHIKVNEGVTLGFSNSAAADCKAPFDINFTNTSTGAGAVNYTWKFGDGNTSSSPNATNIYKAPGVYPVTLIGTNAEGCTDTLTKDISLSETKTDFKWSDTLCANTTLVFTNTSNPKPNSSTWEFPDGSRINGENSSKNFPAPGQYKVKLINAYNACVEAIEKTITIERTPKASFTPSILGRCTPGLKVDFVNTSTDAVKYVWNFGDGSAPLATTATTTSHVFNKKGSFKVSLTAYSNSGCSQTYFFPDSIVIGPPVILSMSVPAGGCVPLKISPQTVVSANPTIVSYDWDFGDGVIVKGKDPEHTYTAVGKYYISVTIVTDDGCTLTKRDSIQIGDHSKLAFTAAPPDVCAIVPIVFTNQSEPIKARYKWEFGDGGNSGLYSPTHTYNDTGYFQVRLESNNNGCIDTLFSAENYIKIQAPIARFSYKPNCNAAFEYQFVDESLFDPGSENRRTWKWTFPDGSISNSPVPPLYTFPGPGEYLISLTISNGNCVHVKNTTVKIVSRAVALSFKIDKTCKPTLATLEAVTQNMPNVDRYRWQFENIDTVTTSSRLQYPFFEAGIRSLKLSTTDIYGCIDSVKNPFEIIGPDALFARTNIEDCRKLTATFSDSSVVYGSNNIVSWTWDYGDGVIEEKKDGSPAAHVYSQPGDYKVKLSVRDAAGCIDTVISKGLVTIKELKAAWSVTENVCDKFPMTYQNKSTGDYTSFAWDFGDGTPLSTAMEGSHTYKDTGYYDLRLSVINAYGCTDTLVKKRHIRIAQPLASFYLKDSISFCPPFDVMFTNTSDFFGKAEWTIGEEKSVDVNHRKLFTQPGKFPVTLKVTSPDNNCVSSITRNIMLYRQEEAVMNYDPLQACLPGLANFSAFDRLASARFYWDFGDGNIMDTSANIIQHTYTDLGSFIPKIIMTESNGCIITIPGIKPIVIKGAKAKFDVAGKFFCDSGYVRILDSTLNNDPIVKYTWDLGDGTISNAKLPVHQYTIAGVYPISLKVETAAGCIDSANLKTPVTLAYSPQVAIVGDSTICINERLLHTGIFMNHDTVGVTWSWVFPNGRVASVQKPPIQQYNVAGNFQIKTIASSTNGCADTVIKNIVVNPLPTVTMP